MNITIEVLKATTNMEMSLEAIKQTFRIVTAARLEKSKQWNRTRFVLDTYLSSAYLYNASTIKASRQLEAANVEVCRTLLTSMTSSRDSSINTSQTQS